MGKVISEFGNIVGGGSSIQLGTMPTYTDVSLGTIVQYIGTTNANYTNGYFYKRGASGWETISVQESAESVFTINMSVEWDQQTGESVYSVDKTPEEVAEAYSAGKILQIYDSEFIYDLILFDDYDEYQFALNRTFTEVSGETRTQFELVTLIPDDDETWASVTYEVCKLKSIQRAEISNADSSDVGTIVQYIGATNVNYTHGCFYECVSNGASTPTYGWQRIDVQPHQDISGKADKVTSATNGNFAGLNSSGNLIDSGKKASDFVLTSAVGTAAAKNVPASGNAGSTEVVLGSDTRLTNSRTPTSHNQAASTITAGTLAGRVQANATAAATLGNAQVRDVTISTTDLTAGTSSLAAGSVYIVYET